MENHDLRRRRDSLVGFLGHELHRLCPSRSVCSHSLLHSDRWLSQISNEEASSLELQDQQPFAVPNAAVLCLQAYVDVQPSLARIHSSEGPRIKSEVSSKVRVDGGAAEGQDSSQRDTISCVKRFGNDRYRC